MQKITKKQLGLIISIVALSDGDKKTKDEMAFDIVYYGLDNTSTKRLDTLIERQKIFNNSLLNQRHSILSINAMDLDPSDYLGKGLRSVEKKIVKRSVGPQKEGKRGSRGYEWYLIKDPKTLYEIYCLVKKLKLEEWDRKHIHFLLNGSEFYQKMLDKEFVSKLNDIPEEEKDWMDSDKDSFTDSELELILQVIKMSPSALNAVLELIYDSEIRKRVVYPSLPEFTLNSVLFGFLDDFRRNWFKSDTPIDCKIEFSIKDPLKPREYIKRTTNTSFNDKKITHEINTNIYTKDKLGNKPN